MTAASAQAARRSGDEYGDSTTLWCDDVRRRALARRPHEPERPLRLRRAAWMLALALHVALIVALRLALRPAAPVASADDVLRVDWIDIPEEPALPQPAPLAPHAVAPPAVQRPVRKSPTDERSALQSEPPPAPEPRLFNPDGTVALPGDIVRQIERAQRQADFIARRFDPSPLLQIRRPLKLRPNHFAAVWSGNDGKPLDQTIWQPVTFVKEFTAPWGGRYACAWVLVLVACSDIPDKVWVPPQRWKPATELDDEQ